MSRLENSYRVEDKEILGNSLFKVLVFKLYGVVLYFFGE